MTTPKKIPNVLVFCAGDIPSVRVGVTSMLDYLSEQGILNYNFKLTEHVKSRDIAWADTVICVRGISWNELRIVEFAAKLEKYRIYFLDDDLTDVPYGALSYNKATCEAAAVNIPQILSLCNKFWSTNPNLLSKFGKHCRSQVLMGAPAVPCMRRTYNSNPGKVNIAFAGSTDHAELIKELLLPVFDKLYSRFREHICIFIIGGSKSELRTNPAVHYIPYFKSMAEYRNAIARIGIDIGLAPIRDTPFYKCKYFNKYLEYSTLGICGIYSNTEPYTFVVKNGYNGLLVRNTVDDWANAISQLVEDIDAVRRMAMTAYEHVTEEYSIQALSSDLKDKIPELLYYKKAPRFVTFIEYIGFDFKQLILISKFMNSVDKYGWRVVPEIIKRVLRKVVRIISNKLERL